MDTSPESPCELNDDLEERFIDCFDALNRKPEMRYDLLHVIGGLCTSLEAIDAFNEMLSAKQLPPLVPPQFMQPQLWDVAFTLRDIATRIAYDIPFSPKNIMYCQSFISKNKVHMLAQTLRQTAGYIENFIDAPPADLESLWDNFSIRIEDKMVKTIIQQIRTINRQHPDLRVKSGQLNGADDIPPAEELEEMSKIIAESTLGHVQKSPDELRLLADCLDFLAPHFQQECANISAFHAPKRRLH